MTADIIKKTILALKDEPTFNLEIHPDSFIYIKDFYGRPQSVMGLYYPKENKIKLAGASPDASAFIHELGHYLYNFLPLNDKLTIIKNLFKKYATIDKYVDLQKEKLAKYLIYKDDEYKSHFLTSFDEYFAEQFKNYVFERGIVDKEVEPLFKKVWYWVKKVWDKIKNQEYVNPEIRPILEKLLKEPPKTTETQLKPEQFITIRHYTKPENIPSILEKGFDTSKPPLFGMKGLEREFGQTKIGGKDVLYFTADDKKWNTVYEYVGEGKGDKDYSYFDYDKQKWITEKKALKKIELKPIEAKIKPDAKILVIDSLNKALNYLGEDTDWVERNSTFLEKIIKKAKKDGYDIVNIKHKLGGWESEAWGVTKYGEKDWYSKLTGGSGEDDYFILNKNVIAIIKKQPTQLHLGINPFEAIKPLDELIANNLNKYDWYNKAFDSLRKIYDPFWDVSREMSKELKQDVIYGKLRPIMAKIDKLSVEKTQTLIKIIEKVENEGDKALKQFITRYFENPEFEKYVNENIPELGEALKPAKDAIANFHNILHNRGYLKQAEYEKWNRAYFARIYARDKEDIIKSTGKIRQPEIQKGREYKDIVTELTEEERKRLGYKLDPISALKLTLAKQGQIIGMDEFFRALMDRKHEIIDPKALPFLVELPEEIAEKYPDLPKLMSPYFMRKRILPWLAQKTQIGEIDKKIVKALGKITNKKIKALENLEVTKGFVNLGDIKKVRYGVLSGLPVRKSIADFVGITYPITIEPDPSKLDKALSFLFTNFKAMKVPLNFMAIPRNWISNYFQWVMSGADPFSYFKYYAKALYHAAKKDNFYEMVDREGLLHTNFASEEIQKVLEKFRQEGKVQGVIRRYFDLVSKLSTPYGLVDDLAKMARVEYEMKKGASLKEAIYKAQFAHYDYGLLPKWAHEARKGDVKIGTAWKIVATPFISYPVKTTELFVEMLRERPLTTLALFSAPIIAKYAIEKKQISNNPKLKKLFKLTPEYMNGSTILRYYHNGKMYYIPLDYIYPTGQIVSELDKGVLGVVLGIAKFFGLGESPLGNIYGAIMGKDPFTGKPVYQEIGDDATHKVAKAIEFLYRTWVEPGSATVLRSWLKTKHPLAPRFAGVNVYAYTPKELALIKKRELQIWKADLFREYFQIMRNESLTKEERKEQVRDLIKKYKERKKELLGGE